MPYKPIKKLHFHSQILSANGTSPAGGRIYVFTDGQENRFPYINDVRDEVFAAESIVFVLLIIQASGDHDLIKLAADTSGSSCIYDESDGGNSFEDCLLNIDIDEPFVVPVMYILLVFVIALFYRDYS